MLLTAERKLVTVFARMWMGR